GKSQVSVEDSFARLARGLGNGPLIVLPVFVPGGSYPESGEARLRMRYAVAAALGVRHYAPSDPEHVGLLTISVPSPMGEGAAQALAIPFEWFQPASRTGSDDRRVLVLWISDQDLPGAGIPKM